MPPRGVTKGSKRARQYEHIKESGEQRGMSEDRAEEMAARTVNTERSEADAKSRGGKRKSRGGTRKKAGSRKSSARGSSRKSAGARKRGRGARKATAKKSARARSTSRGGARKSSARTGSRKTASRKRTGMTRARTGAAGAGATAPMIDEEFMSVGVGEGQVGGGMAGEGGDEEV
jgi:hypothetical protein